MISSRGVVFVAYGEQARVQVLHAAKSLVAHNPGISFRVIADKGFPYQKGYPPIKCIYHEDTDPGARQVKLQMDLLSPYEQTLYLDADTRVQANIMQPFDLLDAGWEMCIVPCRHQDYDEVYGHVQEDERKATFDAIGYGPLALQGGVIYFRKCANVHRLFMEWRREWWQWEDQDQAALMRALVRCPVKLFMLNRAYNGGRYVQHFYTYARRDGLKYSRRV